MSATTSKRSFARVEKENFVRYPIVDKLKSLIRVLPNLVLLPLGIVALYIMTGQSGLDTHHLAKLMADESQRLAEDRPKMKGDRARKLCDLKIELNNLGIEGTNAVDLERELQRTCLMLRSELRKDGSLSKAKSFVETATQLSSAESNHSNHEG